MGLTSGSGKNKSWSPAIFAQIEDGRDYHRFFAYRINGDKVEVLASNNNSSTLHVFAMRCQAQPWNTTAVLGVATRVELKAMGWRGRGDE